jgi:hypothetical protein
MTPRRKLALVLSIAVLAALPALAQQQPRPPRDVLQGIPREGDAIMAPPGSRPAAVQQQPLPPPPGSELLNPTPGVPSIAAPPLPRATKGAPPAQGPAQRPPATIAAPADETVVQPPEQKIANPTVTFSGLDKITGRILTFDVAINETVQYGALQVTPRVCYTRPPTELQNTTAFVEVDEITLEAKIRRVFTGWMFANSPGLSAVEHSIYDVWLIDCKATPPVIGAAAPQR